MSNDQFLHWAEGDLSKSLENTDFGNQFGSSQPNNLAAASNQLIRRNQNQHLMARPTPADEQWSEDGKREATENDADLTARAAVAKKDALARRPPKQIPPFIQKLSR